MKAADELVDIGLTSPDRAHEVRRIGTMGLGVGDRDRVLVDIQTDVQRGRL